MLWLLVLSLILLAGITIFLVLFYKKQRDDAFFTAVAAGALPQVREMLSNDPRYVTVRDKMGRTPLHWAVDYNRLDLVQLLIEQGADVNARTKDKRGTLHLAVLNDRREITELLLSKGADHRIKTEFGRTPLMLATELNLNALVEILRSHGAEE
jgi:ankyrin repeat protein